VNDEPTGPNTPLAKDANGNELYPGPGYNAYLDRPSTCINQTIPSAPAGQCLVGGGTQGDPAARTDSGAYAAAVTSTIIDPSIVATRYRTLVTGTGIPSGAFVGQVADTPTTPASSSDKADVGYFTLVNSSNDTIDTTGPVSGVHARRGDADDRPAL